jgi:hypothetical protein
LFAASAFCPLALLGWCLFVKHAFAERARLVRALPELLLGS